MNNATPMWKLFEDLVRRILEANNFAVQLHSPRGDEGFDFVGFSGDEQWAIEVKYYRTAKAQPTLIETAANRLVNNGIIARARKGMLVVSSVLPPAIRLAFEERFSINFVDRIDLRNWASVDPTLAEELDALVEADLGVPQDSPASREDPRSKSRPLSAVAAPANEKKGAKLSEELMKIKRGKTAWANYEDVCARILKYLFPNDLHGWHKQKRTDDGLNRFDFVCRVRPTTEFWRFLIDHLNSRYVLFEFKAPRCFKWVA